MFAETMRLIIARHGATDWNQTERLQGNVDIPLSNVGKQQAVLLAQRLANEPIEAIYSSSLQRAYKTAQPIAAFFQIPIQQDHRLNEFDWGIFKGISKAERDAHPELGPLWKKVKDNIRFATEHQGETFDQFADRIQLFLQDLTQQQAGQQVLVVAHGFVKRMLLAQLLNKPYEELQDYYWENASFSILRQQQSMFHVEQLHVTDHLA